MASTQDAGQEGAENAPDTVDAEGIEAVVIAEHPLQPGRGDEADDAAGDAHERCALGSTKPDAGVITTRPAMAPDATPSTLGLPWTIHSENIQASAAAAAQICVTRIAMPAESFAAPAEPPLKPNQPTHRSEAPMTVSTRLCGAMLSVP